MVATLVALVVWLAAVALIARASYPLVPGATRVFAVLTVVGAAIAAAGAIALRNARGDATLGYLPVYLFFGLATLVGVGTLAGAHLLRLVRHWRGGTRR
jgi:hypothetical protein